MRINRAVLVILSLFVLALLIFKGRHTNATFSGTTAFKRSPAPDGWVQVEGAVQLPGMQQISANTLTFTAIMLAKPLCQIDYSSAPAIKNRIAISGDRYLVKCKSDSTAGYIEILQISPRACTVMGIPFSINRASAEDLDSLPDIGPETAKRIIEYRQINGAFRTIEELMMIEGIGEKKFSKIKYHLKP